MVSTLRIWTLPALMATAFWFQAESPEYERGRQALDRGEWRGAVSAFEDVADDAPVADGALYWRAYAHNKLGETDRALELATALAERFPNSDWRDDARALIAEIRRAAGGTSRVPVGENAPIEDDELVSMALNALMQADEEEALPILEEFLRGDRSSRLKERALFVLAQMGSDRSYAILADVARNDAEPELQRKAIRYLGVHHSDGSLDLLVDLYGSLDNVEARRAILQSFMVAGERDRLLELARNEPDEDLRGRAIQLLGTMDAADELWTLYQAERSEDMRKKILQAFMVSGDDARLLQVAQNRQETEELRKSAIRLLGAQGANDALWALYQEESSDEIRKRILHGLFISGDVERIEQVARDASTSEELRKAAIHDLGISGRGARPVLLDLYRAESSVELKKRVLHALFLQGAASELVELARAESDVELKKQAVHWLSLMDEPEAREFLLEILRQ